MSKAETTKGMSPELACQLDELKEKILAAMMAEYEKMRHTSMQRAVLLSMPGVNELIRDVFKMGYAIGQQYSIASLLTSAPQQKHTTATTTDKKGNRQ